MEDNKKLEFIAKVRYLGWICYQLGAGLPLHDVGDLDKNMGLSEERLQSMMNGTTWVLSELSEGRDVTPEDNHNHWMEFKREQGYKYGETLDVEAKTHPSMVPFDELSEVEKNKDTMDILMTKLGNTLYNDMIQSR